MGLAAVGLAAGVPLDSMNVGSLLPGQQRLHVHVVCGAGRGPRAGPGPGVATPAETGRQSATAARRRADGGWRSMRATARGTAAGS
jgi:hypothetical protein